MTAEHDYNDAMREIRELRERIDRMQAALDQSRANFAVYGTHQPDCRGGDGERCACGYLQTWQRER